MAVLNCNFIIPDESENKSDTTSSETTEKTKETDSKVEKEVNASSQSAFRSEVTVEHKGSAVEIKGELPTDNLKEEYPMKKEAVLDKMEASMEKSPHVVSIGKDGNAVVCLLILQKLCLAPLSL